MIDDTGGYPINVNWHNGDDIFLFTKEAPEPALKTWCGIEDPGLWDVHIRLDQLEWVAPPQFVAFSEVYTALERGILEAGVTGGDAGLQPALVRGNLATSTGRSDIVAFQPQRGQPVKSGSRYQTDLQEIMERRSPPRWSWRPSGLVPFKTN